MPCCSMGNVVTKVLHFLMYVHCVLALFLNAYMHAYSVFSHYICNIFTTTKQLIHTLTKKKAHFHNMLPNISGLLICFFPPAGDRSCQTRIQGLWF